MEIDKYLQEQLNLIGDTTTNDYLLLLSQQICAKISYEYNYKGNVDDLVKKVYQILVDYQNKSVNVTDAVNLLHKEIGYVININRSASQSSYSGSNTKTNPTKSNPNSTKQKDNKKNNTNENASTIGAKNDDGNNRQTGVIANEEATAVGSEAASAIIDSDMSTINGMSQKYLEAQNAVEEATIEVGSSMTDTSVEEITAIASELGNEVAQEFDEIAEALEESWQSLQAADESIPDIDGKGFNAYLSTTSNYISQKKLKKAQIDFFKSQGCKIENGKVIIQDGGITYTYTIANNIGNSILEIYNSEMGTTDRVYVQYFIPDGTQEYRSLNTVNYLINDDFSRNLEDYCSDSILITSFYDKNKIEEMRATLITNYAYATSFINKVVKADTSKIHNTIIGSSEGGAYALQILRSDTFDSAVCVNNALIVKNENGIGSGKAQFSQYEDVFGLDGKDVFFVSAKNDTNIYRIYDKSTGKAWPDENNCKDVRNGYFYTGLKLLLDACPHSRVHVITNNREVAAFKELSDYPNYDYSSEYWSIFNLGDSNTEHGHSGNIIQNMLASSMLQ